jgi:hypothetical protein
MKMGDTCLLALLSPHSGHFLEQLAKWQNKAKIKMFKIFPNLEFYFLIFSNNL